MAATTILIIGTYDTKQDELEYIRDVIEEQGGSVLTMDVSVLGRTAVTVTCTKEDVAAQAAVSIADVIATGGENDAMTLMSHGACALATKLCNEGRIHGMIALGGTMGTDLALDVALALPLGLPKYVISTVAFSALIPPERLAADIQMILWAGGLHGLNYLCRSALRQAAGAVLGSAKAVLPIERSRPLVGVTSLGNACLKYMGPLKLKLEARGFEVAFFHSTGMGGRAFETLARQGAFAAVFDLCLQEFSNGIHGSIVNSGNDRLENAGRFGIPQIVAPGAADLLDVPTWQEIPERFRDRPRHVHNKLISSLTLSAEERRHTAREIARRLNAASGPTHLILPHGGIQEWDRKGEVGHDPAGHSAFLDELRRSIRPTVGLSETAAHINDKSFVDSVMVQFDRWVASGVVPSPAGPGRPEIVVEPVKAGRLPQTAYAEA